MSKVSVVVLGRNYTSRLGMIRAVGSAGYDVYVIKTTKRIPSKYKLSRQIDGFSKYVKGTFWAIEPKMDALIEQLNSLFSQKGTVVLIPTDDFTAAAIDLGQNKLASNFLYPSVSRTPGAVVRLMDKEYQKELALAYGLNVAKSWTVKIESSSYTLPDTIEYPVFTKPLVSYLGNKDCMKKCSDEAELRFVIDKVKSTMGDCSILIEEYFEIEREFATLGVSNGKDVLLPAMIELKQQGHGSHRGVTLLGEVFPKEEFSKELDQFAGFISTLGFTGLFDIDAYLSKGKIYFNELNMRFGASGYAVTHQGVNLPSMLIDTLLGKENAIGDKGITSKATFYNEKVCVEDYKEGYMTKGEYKSIKDKVDFGFIKSEDDPSPYRRFNFLQFLSSIKRII